MRRDGRGGGQKNWRDEKCRDDRGRGTLEEERANALIAFSSHGIRGCLGFLSLVAIVEVRLRAIRLLFQQSCETSTRGSAPPPLQTGSCPRRASPPTSYRAPRSRAPDCSRHLAWLVSSSSSLSPKKVWSRWRITLAFSGASLADLRAEKMEMKLDLFDAMINRRGPVER